MRRAILIVGLQNDFLAGGALEVPGGDRVAGPISCLANTVDEAGGLVVACREWHSAESPYFRGHGGSWPPFCVAGTRGAAFPPSLTLTRKTRFVFRARDPDEGFSIFRAIDREGRPLLALLREAGIDSLFVGGMPTERAVKASVLEALRQGFPVTVIQDATAALDPAAGREAFQDLRLAGARVVSSGQAIMALFESGEVRI